MTANIWSPEDSTEDPDVYFQVQTFVVTVPGQQLFNLSFSYTVGTNSSQVFFNGLRSELTVDYTETSATSITLVRPTEVGDRIVVIAGTSVSSVAPPDTVSAVALASVTGAELVGTADGDTLAEALVVLAEDIAAVGLGKHAIYIAAPSFIPSASGGCAALATIATSANQPDLSTLDFDATAAEYAQFSIVMPTSWNEGTITFKAHWSHAATTTNFGVAWNLQAVAASNDDPIAVAYGTAVTVTDTGGTTNDLYTTAESAALTVGGTPQPEDMVFFRAYRDPANGSDNLAVDARLHGITLYITTNAQTDN